MSQATEHTASACDGLLDYVYGELSGAALDEFKAHLESCDQCKRELAGLERVRSAVKQALPSVEPASEKFSAMHAQLMHAAAQQKPKQGKLLLFARRMVSHPAYAAAAALVIVGGAVAYNFTAGRVMMPAAEKVHEEVPIAAPAAPPPAPTTVEFAGKTGMKEEAAPADKDEKAKPAAEPKVILETPSASYAVRRAAPAKGSASADDLKLMTKDVGKRDDSFDGLGGDFRSQSGGGAMPSRTRTAHHAAAPAPRQAKKAEMDKLANMDRPAEGRMSNQGMLAQQNQAPQKAPVAPPPPPGGPAQATAPAAQAERVAAAAPTTTPALEPKPQPADPATLKKQAEAYASSGHCAEAIALYERIEKLAPRYLKPAERLEYVRCLRETGRAQDADAIAAEEQKVSVPSRASKKASKSKATKSAY